jgi:protocatechuate 3,4-dioxygenase beta subunit
MKRTASHLVIIALPAALVALGAAWRTLPTGFERLLSRRGFFRRASLGLTALAAVAWRARTAMALRPNGLAPRAPGCVLTPEQTEGPYYISGEKVRKNIVERRPGTPLTLRFTVVDATTCTPLRGAAVDIWHCDASGIYSGFESASAGGAPGGNAGPTDHDTFLRGIQRTDARGHCEFQTIYPGWYRGRTTHIHVKVHVGGNVVHTGQLYFQDSLTDRVYQTGVYRARAAQRDTRNATDSIYQNGGPQSTLSMNRLSSGGYSGAITLGVRS